MLSHTVSPHTKLIVEVGCGAGQVTRRLAALAPQATLVAIGPWQETTDTPATTDNGGQRPTAYEEFLARCWGLRERVIPVRADAVEALQRVAEAGLEPDWVYLGADCRFDDFCRSLTCVLDLFPRAGVGGEDTGREQVRRVLEGLARDRGLRYERVGPAWRLLPVRPAAP
jgi:hypothetical protein